LKKKAYKDDQHRGETRWSGNILYRRNEKHGKKLRSSSFGKNEKDVRAWLLHDTHYMEMYEEEKNKTNKEMFLRLVNNSI
jgi:hypothetical protein